MITVIIPVLNESPTVASAQRAKDVSEVIVVDDGSSDGTPELALSAGARVVTSTLLGKGASMGDGVWAAQNEIVVFLDGDLSGLADDLIERITAPLLNDRAEFVKAKFTRAAGRVTVLTARPLLVTFFPNSRISISHSAELLQRDARCFAGCGSKTITRRGNVPRKSPHSSPGCPSPCSRTPPGAFH